MQMVPLVPRGAAARGLGCIEVLAGGSLRSGRLRRPGSARKNGTIVAIGCIAAITSSLLVTGQSLQLALMASMVPFHANGAVNAKGCCGPWSCLHWGPKRKGLRRRLLAAGLRKEEWQHCCHWLHCCHYKLSARRGSITPTGINGINGAISRKWCR